MATEAALETFVCLRVSEFGSLGQLRKQSFGSVGGLDKVVPEDLCCHFQKMLILVPPKFP